MTVWATIGGLAAATFLIRAAGPVALGGRELPKFLARIVPMLAPALIAALVAVDTFGGAGRSLSLNARVVGLGAAGIALWLRAPILLVVACAGAATAVARLIT